MLTWLFFSLGFVELQSSVVKITRKKIVIQLLYCVNTTKRTAIPFYIMGENSVYKLTVQEHSKIMKIFLLNENKLFKYTRAEYQWMYLYKFSYRQPHPFIDREIMIIIFLDINFQFLTFENICPIKYTRNFCWEIAKSLFREVMILIWQRNKWKVL